MVRFNSYTCPRDGCPEAYPHGLLRDYHILVDHGLKVDLQNGGVS